MSKVSNQLFVSSVIQIKYRMKQMRITQKDLATRLGMHQSTLIRNFKGETEMALTTFIDIMLILEMNISFQRSSDGVFYTMDH